MKRAKFINRNSIEVIDYDKEVERIEKVYEEDIARLGVADGVLQPIVDKATDKRTPEEVELLEKRKIVEADKEAALNLLSEYQDFVETDFDGELGEFESVVPYYSKKNGTIVQKWEVIKGDESKISSKIETLKTELSNSTIR